MKLSKHLEEAVYVLLILATQKDQQALKSKTLSKLLEVSDSSLKKVLRQLVVNNLIESTASKDGGFKLKKRINEISLKDVMAAVEGEEFISADLSYIGQRIFPNKAHTLESESLVIETLTKAQNLYALELEKLKLSDLLLAEAMDNKTLDWLKRE
ncbi:Rrf2 family transcriptional regulator [Lactococcus cremoris]|uniref:Rrf2 family transcriptional regulator n=1 Tax=Lactococcus lactis subsp. cremoris TaxID=1359 RepID=A0A1V0PIR7_LACLC|nr:Rrf2 family transcriptional regulator [Lactococcus cremoris]ARE29123.1 Rrf2 family transcriptional regulator [Lactococcus cremoris]EUN34813.1 Rrf2 family protein [Lactococcus cremoris subsp. cremoris HP]KZK09910.1 Rrf2 family transcriptional regulator [Lactococcus cremoris]KZK34273.1 Rrf2 family transcriptional regulator [Lactococcus cremoris]KZK44956.1 Rrf2 family transcriptional regulator [Lactococcus cremoris]